MFTFYEVGGKVRDELLGKQSKDIDYTVVLDDELLKIGWTVGEVFDMLQEHLIGNGYQVFLSTKECLTIRAKFPVGHVNEGTVADFVLARKDIGYMDGTRTPIVAPGTLHDDLQRRDFTVNAIAKASDGRIIDPFNGRADLKSRLLRTPIDCKITFNDDPLRILRGIRFSITKGLMLTNQIRRVMETFDYEKKMKVVSEERIREELYKCFKYDSLYTMDVLANQYPAIGRYIFRNTKLWLKPTNEL